MFHHPKFGNNFGDELSMTEKSHYRTLRDHKCAPPWSRHPCWRPHCDDCRVTAAHPPGGHSIEETARGKDDSIVTQDEPTVQLRQSLDGSAEIEIGDVAQRLRMPPQTIQNQRSGFGEHGILIPSANNVPTRRPARPSRASSTASPIIGSRTSGPYSVTSQRMLSNIIAHLAAGRHQVVTTNQ